MGEPQLKRCPVCKGRGALRCDCWPGDCICGWDDEPCDECGGNGWIDPTYDDYDDYPSAPARLDGAHDAGEG